MTGRAWAYAGAALGGAVSVAANEAHSYVPPAGARPDWHPQAGAVAIAAFWPVALLLALEILARNPLPRGLQWVLVRLGLVPVAAVAAVVSYRHMSGLLAWYGEERLTAVLGPLAVDGLMVMAAGVLLSRTVALDTAGQVSTPGTSTPDPVGALEDQLYMPEIPEQPDGAAALIYRLFDDEGELLYIGCTVHPRKRFHSHRRRQPWWDEVADSELMWYPSVEAAAVAEQQAIRTEQPIYNIGLARYLGPAAGQGPEPAAPTPTAGPDRGTGQSAPPAEDNVPPLDEPGWQLVARAFGLSEAAARKRVQRGGDKAIAQARARVNGHKP